MFRYLYIYVHGVNCEQPYTHSHIHVYTHARTHTNTRTHTQTHQLSHVHKIYSMLLYCSSMTVEKTARNKIAVKTLAACNGEITAVMPTTMKHELFLASKQTRSVSPTISVFRESVHNRKGVNGIPHTSDRLHNVMELLCRTFVCMGQPSLRRDSHLSINYHICEYAYVNKMYCTL